MVMSGQEGKKQGLLIDQTPRTKVLDHHARLRRKRLLFLSVKLLIRRLLKSSISNEFAPSLMNEDHDITDSM
uniref:Putative ovule protein n=1 Tax=Solanum chacoense TaxID=4108 RepID=A0A0V0HX86_SOLCH